MIAILLDGVSFEQDIRELFMAFYPGESFVYTDKKVVDIIFIAKSKSEDAGNIFCEIQFRDATYTFRVHVYNTRLETKNALKRELYQILSKETREVLPWGTLTGIRPTKIAMEGIERGESIEEIKKYLKQKYLVSEEKTKLCVETACMEHQILKDIDYEEGYSLYIGIPFCPTRCAYCSFTAYSVHMPKSDTKSYVEALCKELYRVSDMQKGKKLQTIYMGGGTPTALSLMELDMILTFVHTHFDLSDLLELTVEAGRPDSIDREKLLILKKHGVGRISINPQTMQQRTLDLIGRDHTIEEVYSAFRLAREVGFENINMDLILGLNGESLEDVRDTFTRIEAFHPESITVHTLAKKRASRLTILGQHEKKTNDEMRQMLEISRKTCEGLGLFPYYLYRQKNMAGNMENVGYAKPGSACIYNILIMEEKQTIIACGAGTSSKIVFPKENRLERIENIKDPWLYIERLEEMVERKEKLLCHS